MSERRELRSRRRGRACASPGLPDLKGTIR